MRVRLGSTRVLGGAMVSSALLVGSLAFAGEPPRAPEPADAPAAVDAASGTKSAEAKPADAKTAKSPDRIDKTIDAFAKSVEGNASLDATKRQAILDAIASQRADADRRTTTITDVLAATHDDYRVALGALAEENITAGVAALEKLSKSDDAYLAADASFFLARAYMMDERAESSVPLLKKLTGELADRTLYSGEAQYLLGAGQAALLDRKAATETLEKFLKENPDAPERLRVGAQRIVEELKTLKDGTLVDIYDRMGFSRRKLQIEDSGNTTRKEQDKIIAMLDVLIKEAEDKEGCGTCPNGGGSGRGRGRGGKGGKNPAQGAKQSTAPTGSASVGKQGTPIGSKNGWNVMRDKDREKVLAGLKGNVPDRYRKLIETYYKNLQEEESRK